MHSWLFRLIYTFISRVSIVHNRPHPVINTDDMKKCVFVGLDPRLGKQHLRMTRLFARNCKAWPCGRLGRLTPLRPWLMKEISLSLIRNWEQGTRANWFRKTTYWSYANYNWLPICVNIPTNMVYSPKQTSLQIDFHWPKHQKSDSGLAFSFHFILNLFIQTENSI